MLLGMPEDSVLYAIAPPGKGAVYLDTAHWGRRLVSVQGDMYDLKAFGTADLMGIDILFTDFRPTALDCERARNLYRGFLSRDAIIVMDDIHLNLEMERLWSQIEEPKLDTGKDFHWSGFGLIHPDLTR
jgi:hypothetical protein